MSNLWIICDNLCKSESFCKPNCIEFRFFEWKHPFRKKRYLLEKKVTPFWGGTATTKKKHKNARLFSRLEFHTLGFVV